MSWEKIAAYTDKDILDVLLYPYNGVVKRSISKCCTDRNANKV